MFVYILLLHICEVLDLIVVRDLVLLSLANTQMTWSPVP